MLITYIVEALFGATWLPITLSGAAITSESEALDVANELRREVAESETKVMLRIAVITYRAERVYPNAVNIHRWVEVGRTYIELDWTNDAA